MKVEFLAQERRETSPDRRYLKEIAVTPQALRFLDILFVEPLVLKIGPGIHAKVPDRSAFILHKLVIATRPGRREKKEIRSTPGVLCDQFRAWRKIGDGQVGRALGRPPEKMESEHKEVIGPHHGHRTA